MKYKHLALFSTLFIGTSLWSQEPPTTTTTVPDAPSVEIVLDDIAKVEPILEENEVTTEEVESVQKAAVAQEAFKLDRNSETCLYGGFYSQMNEEGYCTHPLNSTLKNHKEYYVKSCQEVFKHNGKEDSKKRCESDINFNVCNPILFGKKRTGKFLKPQYVNAGKNLGDYSTFTSLSCYTDTHNDDIEKSNMNELIENLKDEEKFQMFLELTQDMVQVCLCDNNLEKLNSEYGAEISETNTCDALLFRLRNVLNDYLCKDETFIQTETTEFLTGLSSEILDHYEEELMDRMQAAIDKGDRKKFQEYLKEYRDYVGANDNPPNKSKDTKRKKEHPFLSEFLKDREDDWKAQYCVPIEFNNKKVANSGAEPCEEGNIKMIVENSCTGSKVFSSFCNVTVSFESACGDLEIEKIRWQHPEVKDRMVSTEEDGEKTKGTMEAEKAEKFNKAMNNKYDVSLFAKVKYKLKNSEEENEVDLSETTSIPQMIIQNNAPMPMNLDLSIDAN